MTAADAIIGELLYAQEQARPVLHIRVSADAIEGSPVAVPITPERARTVALRAFEAHDGSAAVEADPVVYARALEVVVHPADWLHVLIYSDLYMRSRGGRITEFHGVRVLLDEPVPR